MLVETVEVQVMPTRLLIWIWLPRGPLTPLAGLCLPAGLMFFLTPPAGATALVGLVLRRGRPPRPWPAERLVLRISSRDWLSLVDMMAVVLRVAEKRSLLTCRREVGG